MKSMLLLLLLSTVLTIVSCSSQTNSCDIVFDTKNNQVDRITELWKGKPITTILPKSNNSDDLKLPLIVFMHGSTGQIEMYDDVLNLWVANGFVVAFPYVKSPEKDKSPFTTNTNGEYILRAIEYVHFQANSNTSSLLYSRVDTQNIVIAGHSMGATCAIKGGERSMTDDRVPKGSVKLVSTQHPGICGPFGPPPLPATWMPSDMESVLSSYPVLHTTATNDNAFWPAPNTAVHELGCFEKSTKTNNTHIATFVQFSAEACKDEPYGQWNAGGHNCPFKKNVEAPWVVVAAKLYTYQNGDMNSPCAKLLYGGGLNDNKDVEKVLFRNL
jgi:hypothetical protein